MKTREQLEVARLRLRERCLEPGLTDVQTALVMGMMNAVLWALDATHSDTMDRMLSDEPLAAGKSHSKAFDRLKGLRGDH